MVFNMVKQSQQVKLKNLTVSLDFPQPKVISFRNEITEIASSKYLTHSLYYHPAKFIPQIVRYCLNNYCDDKGIVLDPFAGSGTTALEASIKGNDSYMIDINPLLDYFYPVKMPAFDLKEWDTYHKNAEIFLKKVLNEKTEKRLDINGELGYWYPDELYDYFVGVWSNYHNLKDNEDKVTQNIVILVLFRLSKLYSFAEHSLPKLFISKRKKEFIRKFLEKKNRSVEIEKKALVFLRGINTSVSKLLKEQNLKGKIKYFSGTDSYKFDFNRLPELNCIITSPPYLQAQEYIRTFKLEMRWAGISNEAIKKYSEMEIPFRSPEGTIHGEYIDCIRQKVNKKELGRLFDSYFWFTIKTLENSSKRLRKGGKLCVLIGNPKMEGMEVEIWKVIYEHFVMSLGFKPITVFEDRIVSRKMFKGRNNLNPEGMKSEYLLVLEKS